MPEAIEKVLTLFVKGVKRALVFMLVVSVLHGSLPLFEGSFVKAAGSDVIQNDETGIPDRNLYQLILSTLGKAPGDTFTEEEAQNVKMLSQGRNSEDDIERKEEEQIVSLQGMEKLTNLSYFAPGRNKVTDLKPLANLKNLKALDLVCSYCLTNIEEIRGLTQLSYLGLPDTITDLNAVQGMTELSSLRAMNADINALPDMTGHTKLTGHDTYLQGNRLTKKELTAKLPKQLVEDKKWMKQTIDLQTYNVKKRLKVTSPRKTAKITSKTKKIVGKADKTLWVGLYCINSLPNKENKLVREVKVDKNGTFKMKNLNLAKYKKAKMILKSYYKNSYYGEDWEKKTMTFKLRK